MNAALIERLTGVDITHSHNNSTVHQQGFDGNTSLFAGFIEQVSIKSIRKGLHTQILDSRMIVQAGIRV